MCTSTDDGEGGSVDDSDPDGLELSGAYFARFYGAMEPEARIRRYVLFLTTYLDDSGSNDSSPVFTLGGFISSVPQWEKCMAAWKASCRETPRIGYYKTNHALGFKGDFRNWTEDDRNLKIRLLAKTILENGDCYSVSSSVPKKLYAEIVNAARFRPEYQDPYFIAAWLLVTGVCQSAFASKATKIDFVFDAGGAVRPLFKNFFDYVFKPRYETLGECSFIDDRECALLQAADMNAAFLHRCKLPIQVWTASDVYLQQIPKQTFEADRTFLNEIREYANSHRQEIGAWIDGYHALSNLSRAERRRNKRKRGA